MRRTRQFKHGLRRAATVAVVSAVVTWLPAAAMASASGPTDTTATAAVTAHGQVQPCTPGNLQSTQDHIGRIAEVSAINQLDAVTVTISNYGPECGTLAASLTLGAATSQSGVVWPKIYWSVGGGPWLASPTSMVGCRGSGASCLFAYLPQSAPIPSNQSTLAVAVDFTSWDDSLYSFSGAIALNDDGYPSSTSLFGLNSTNDWLLNCPSCVVVNPTTALPPGAGHTTPPPPAPGGGSGSQRSTTAPGNGAGNSSTTGNGTTQSTSPTAATPTPKPDATSASASPTSATPTPSTYAAAALPSPSASPPAQVDLAASTTNDSASWLIGTGIVAIAAAVAGTLFLVRKRRLTDAPTSSSEH